MCVCASTCSAAYLESPEGVGGVGVSVEEAGGLGPGAEQILCRQTLSLGDVPDLEDKRPTISIPSG